MPPIRSAQMQPQWGPARNAASAKIACTWAFEEFVAELYQVAMNWLDLFLCSVVGYFEFRPRTAAMYFSVAVFSSAAKRTCNLRSCLAVSLST